MEIMGFLITSFIKLSLADKLLLLLFITNIAVILIAKNLQDELREITIQNNILYNKLSMAEILVIQKSEALQQCHEHSACVHKIENDLRKETRILLSDTKK